MYVMRCLCPSTSHAHLCLSLLFALLPVCSFPVLVSFFLSQQLYPVCCFLSESHCSYSLYLSIIFCVNKVLLTACFSSIMIKNCDTSLSGLYHLPPFRLHFLKAKPFSSLRNMERDSLSIMEYSIKKFACKNRMHLKIAEISAKINARNHLLLQ